jgi:serine/threonine protein kinase
MSSALTYLETKGIVHNDIKPRNIAYSPNRGAVIFDFGLASLSNEVSFCGSPWYVPPELISNSKRSSAGDVWAFGITMLYVLQRIDCPESIVESWSIHEIRQARSMAAQRMRRWLGLVKQAREGLDRANPIEHVTYQMLDEDQHSRITAAAMKSKVDRMQ